MANERWRSIRVLAISAADAGICRRGVRKNLWDPRSCVLSVLIGVEVLEVDVVFEAGFEAGEEVGPA